MATQKITVHVDQSLLQRARKRTGKGVSDTIRQGLTLVAAGAAYQKLRALRGRVKFSVNVRALREDRSRSRSTPARSSPTWQVPRAPTSTPSRSRSSMPRPLFRRSS